MKFAIWLRALTLFGFSFLEIAVPFVRTFILTHLLGPYEFGFAVAISITYSTFEQFTDLSLYRFIFSKPRSEYKEAIAGAHALTILRGLSIASCVLIVSYPLACTLAGCSDWPSFAWLAPVMIIRSFEHLDIRVGERDYRYWPQLTASFASHGAGLIALTLTAYETENHYGFIAYLLVQATVYVLASHFLASNRYRAKLKTPYLRGAFVFGFPLTLNGAGLAIIGQGDRFVVGALLGLPFLGFYSVVVLAGLLPIGGLFKISVPFQMAGLHNAQVESGEYYSRLQLFSRWVPMIAGCYALGLIALLKTVVPLVFGARYTVSDPVLLLLTLIAFVRIVRTEPHTSVLLHTSNTGKLATANLSSGVGLFIATALVIAQPSIEAVLAGVLVGEIVGLCVIILMTRSLFGSAIIDFGVSLLAMLAIVVAAGVLVIVMPNGNIMPNRAAIAAGFFILILIGAGVFLPGSYRRAYGTRVS